MVQEPKALALQKGRQNGRPFQMADGELIARARQIPYINLEGKLANFPSKFIYGP
jgi:hypothetical protein